MGKTLKFFKYQGAGNDFIIIDNRKANWTLSDKQVEWLCNRRIGIGADGLMLLKEADDYDFEMVYHNADGNLGSMCGNGGRCIVAFAYRLGLFKETTRFLAYDGSHFASIREDGTSVKLQMRDVNEITRVGKDWVLDTGSPHYIQTVSKLADYPVKEQGRAIRNQPDFKEQGINVNFVEAIKEGYAVRTYERGVEDETMACGTGVTAVAIAKAFEEQQTGVNLVTLQVPGGTLEVTFNYLGGQQFSDIFLQGPARFVFEGSIQLY